MKLHRAAATLTACGQMLREEYYAVMYLDSVWDHSCSARPHKDSTRIALTAGAATKQHCRNPWRSITGANGCAKPNNAGAVGRVHFQFQPRGEQSKNSQLGKNELTSVLLRLWSTRPISWGKISFVVALMVGLLIQTMICFASCPPTSA